MSTVLVAGATGMLGSQIADALLDQSGLGQADTTVRLLVRAGWADDDARRGRVEPLVQRGATVVEGDVSDPATLEQATEGVDVVVSALQGGDDVIVDGQIALAEAAVRKGVRRFIPSDFAIDLFRAPEGAPQFDVRRRAAKAIDAMDLEVLHVLSGGFMDMMLNPSYPGMIDLQQGLVQTWGTGDEPFDLTTVPDTARFTARLATDDSAAAGVHTLSGSLVSFADIGREIEKVTGKPMQVHSFGDVDGLRSAIDAKGGGWNAIMEWYLLSMLTTPPLENPANDRYDDVRPTTVSQHVAAAYAGR